MPKVMKKIHKQKRQPLKQTYLHYKNSINNLRQIFLLLLLTTLIQVSEAAPCYYSNQNGSNCTLCLNTNKTSVISCNSNGPTRDCYKTCCVLSYSVTLPNNCITPEQNGSGLSVGSIAIIVIFSIPVLVCIIMVFCSWISNRTPAAQPPNNRAPITEVNLQQYNIQECFPYIIDVKQTCSICLQDECHIMTLCGHTYHQTCLQAWIKKRQNCPLCVSTVFNPIAIFCIVCAKCLKMNTMFSHMTQQRNKEWEDSLGIKCENCKNGHVSQEIQISLEQDEVQRYQEKVQRKNPLDSQQRIMKNQVNFKSIQ